MSTTARSPLHIVVMGVSGAGKSAVGQPLAERLGFAYAEGDDFHPQANVRKMAAGRPLDDDDRWPWLRALADWTRERDEAGESTVIACSALKRSYREVLSDGLPGTWFVHLQGEQALLLQRMGARDHFMAPSMLQSQRDTLEELAPDEQGFAVDVDHPVEVIVDKVARRLPVPL